MTLHSKKSVALIVNCFNSESYLCETLDSLVDQTYTNISIFCVDNNSSDSTESIILRYKSKYNFVKLISFNKTLPLVNARIKALHEISNIYEYSYFGFCDSDDLWHKDWVKLLINTSQNNDLLFCNGNELRNNNKLVPVSNCLANQKKDFFSSPLYLQSVLFSTSILDLNSFLDTNLTLLYDIDLFTRLFKSNASYIHISNNLFTYRIHSNSLAANKKYTILKERFLLTRKYKLSLIRYFIKSIYYILK